MLHYSVAVSLLCRRIFPVELNPACGIAPDLPLLLVCWMGLPSCFACVDLHKFLAVRST